MPVSRITREELVEQSVTDWLREQMFTVRGYPPTRVELVDAFARRRFPGPLDKNYLAIGFNFDDGGTPAELGSDLLRRQYTIEVWVIGTSAAGGPQPRQRRPRLDGVRGDRPAARRHRSRRPIIDYLIVDPVRAAPAGPGAEAVAGVPVDRHVPVIDEYHARAGLSLMARLLHPDRARPGAGAAATCSCSTRSPPTTSRAPARPRRCATCSPSLFARSSSSWRRRAPEGRRVHPRGARTTAVRRRPAGRLEAPSTRARSPPPLPGRRRRDRLDRRARQGRGQPALRRDLLARAGVRAAAVPRRGRRPATSCPAARPPSQVEFRVHPYFEQMPYARRACRRWCAPGR
jgi:hypothetical protein